MEWSQQQSALSSKTPLMHRQGVDGDDGDGARCKEEGEGGGEGGGGGIAGAQHALLSENALPQLPPAADRSSDGGGAGWVQLAVAGAPMVPSGSPPAPRSSPPPQQQPLPLEDSGVREVAASVLVGGLAWQDVEAIPFTDPVTGKEVSRPQASSAQGAMDHVQTSYRGTCAMYLLLLRKMMWSPLTRGRGLGRRDLGYGSLCFILLAVQ